MDPLSAFLHSPGWERSQQAAGHVVSRQDGNIAITHTLPARGSYTLLSRCELPPHWQPAHELRQQWFLRIEPADAVSYEHLLSAARHLNLRLVPTAAVQPRQTTFIDLTQSEEVLLSSMKSKHRYNIGVARKHGVQVELIQENLLEQFPRFWNLLEQTASRQGFRTHSRAYYETQLRELEPEGMVSLGFATLNGQDLATIMLVTYLGTTTYLHGASSELHRETMAPYLLHWTAMCAAKERGHTAYDFWGTDAVQRADGTWQARTGHASEGTTRFKLGFGGEVVPYPGSFDLIFNPFCYTLYKSIRSIRSRKRAFS